MWTVSSPTGRSARPPNAALVRSTCLEPLAQPAQESTTRAKTHFLGVLHTRYVSECMVSLDMMGLTFEEFKTFGLGCPPFECECGGERLILYGINVTQNSRQDCVGG